MSDNSKDTADTPVIVTGLYMVVFYAIYLLMGYLLFGIGLAQLLVKLLSGQPQPDLQRFGTTLSTYMAQIVEYIAMRSPVRPFPFSDWPTSADQSAEREDQS